MRWNLNIFLSRLALTPSSASGPAPSSPQFSRDRPSSQGNSCIPLHRLVQFLLQEALSHHDQQSLPVDQNKNCWNKLKEGKIVMKGTQWKLVLFFLNKTNESAQHYLSMIRWVPNCGGPHFRWIWREALKWHWTCFCHSVHYLLSITILIKQSP